MIPLCVGFCKFFQLFFQLTAINEVEGIDDASVIIRHLSVGITAETVLKPIVTNCLNSVRTKK